MKVIPPPQMHNLEEHHYNSIKKKSRHVSTIVTNKPYAICKFEKQTLEQGYHIKSKPKGTFYKITPVKKKSFLKGLI